MRIDKGGPVEPALVAEAPEQVVREIVVARDGVDRRNLTRTCRTQTCRHAPFLSRPAWRERKRDIGHIRDYSPV